MNIDKWVAVLITANTTLHAGVEKGTAAKSWHSSPCPIPSGIVAENIVTAHHSKPSVAPNETNASAVANASPACPKDSVRAWSDESTSIFWTDKGCFMLATSRRVTAALKDAAAICGITQRVNPHALRHSYATGLLRNGVDVRAIQEQMGHSHLETTEIYLHPAGMKSVTSPLDVAASNVIPLRKSS